MKYLNCINEILKFYRFTISSYKMNCIAREREKKSHGAPLCISAIYAFFVICLLTGSKNEEVTHMYEYDDLSTVFQKRKTIE